ncbi:pseudouridine synthase [Eisenbergiella tayi]|uniref:pseudouridine synthase n=1 Tax=Eisenbergiella tayi TaxID=1432052 RepID=UPI0008488186|nr:pseudouridine synthase [Eisenbergiella tayi]ODR34932.1 23S rRNA pseudouridine synthase F [Eisenbergiella tayi]
MNDSKKEERLNKYLADCGICSRREADRMIEAGRVIVNGVPAQMGMRISETDNITVDGRPLDKKDRKVVLAYYKPVGVTCTEKDKYAEKTIRDAIDYPIRVTYAGRLDKDSEGLLLLTNDGDLINGLMRAANYHEKEYLVRVNKPITDTFLQKMAEGVFLKELNVQTRPCQVEKEGKFVFRIVLTQGLNRQIRRMCRALGFDAQGIKRVRVANITIGKLKPGNYRLLTAEELDELYGQLNS